MTNAQIERAIEVGATQEQIDLWLGGALIQTAMCNFTADKREYILTGLTQEDWDLLFNSDEEY